MTASLPLRALAVGDERDLSRVEPGAPHRRSPRATAPAAASPAPAMASRRSDFVAQRARRRRRALRRRSSRARRGRSTSRRRRRLRAIVLNWSRSGRPFTTADELSELSMTMAIAVGAWPLATHRATGRAAASGDRQDRQHAEQHQDEISKAQRAAVLSLGAREIARRGELDARARAPPHQMDEQRHGDAQTKQQIQRREEAHGSCWRAAKARRSGTPKGASVDTTS